MVSTACRQTIILDWRGELTPNVSYTDGAGFTAWNAAIKQELPPLTSPSVDGCKLGVSEKVNECDLYIDYQRKKWFPEVPSFITQVHSIVPAFTVNAPIEAVIISHVPDPGLAPSVQVLLKTNPWFVVIFPGTHTDKVLHLR